MIFCFINLCRNFIGKFNGYLKITHKTWVWLFLPRYVLAVKIYFNMLIEFLLKFQLWTQRDKFVLPHPTLLRYNSVGKKLIYFDLFKIPLIIFFFYVEQDFSRIPSFYHKFNAFFFPITENDNYLWLITLW